MEIVNIIIKDKEQQHKEKLHIEPLDYAAMTADYVAAINSLDVTQLIEDLFRQQITLEIDRMVSEGLINGNN